MEDQDYSSYKLSHGMLMENNNGTTFVETVTVLMPAPLSVVLTGLTLQILLSFNHVLSAKLWLRFLVEFCLLVLPLLLNITVSSDFVYVLVVIMSFVCVILLVPTIIIAWRTGSKYLYIPVKEARRPYITNFRSSINLTTSLCILAVDFTIFPRRFAKTESCGVSLMDTGVGGFIFSNAVVAREVHGLKTDTPARAVWKAVISSLPLILLGIARLASTSSLEYYVNVTEYGVHWNFFFTLAVCKVLCTVLISVFPVKYSAFLSLAVICCHQFLLASGVQDWVLSDSSRNTFFSANREGIISCNGYVALYLSGVHIGRLLQSKRVFLKDYLQLAAKLLCAALLFSFVGEAVHWNTCVSRRLANFGYFISTVAYNLLFLTAFLLAELVLTVFEYTANQRLDSKTSKHKQINQITFVPNILVSISYNGLFFFLIANLCTGFVNLYTKTIYMNALGGIVLLMVYSFVLCSTIVLLHVKQIQLKVW